MVQELPDGEFFAMDDGKWVPVVVLNIDHDDFDGDGLIYTIRLPDGTVTYRDRKSVESIIPF